MHFKTKSASLQYYGIAICKLTPELDFQKFGGAPEACIDIKQNEYVGELHLLLE